MLKQPKYPLRRSLPRLSHHTRIPSDAIELARIEDVNDDTYVYIFLKWSGLLVVMGVSDRVRYSIDQYEYPLEMLQWLSDALTGFRKPPAEGGLHSGAMTSADEDVGGEMLCIQRAMSAAVDKEGVEQGGYCILNRSRNDHRSAAGGAYHPVEVCFADNLLFEGGLLQLIQNLADDYHNGKI
jgi:hypothetical protein